jgi:L-fucose mutarotase
MERFDFYDKTKQAFAIVATTESALYANIILKKGIVEG